VVRVNQACQVSDERLEILFAGAVRGCLDDRTERREFFVFSARHGAESVRGRKLLGRFFGTFVCLDHGYLPDDEGPNQPEHCPGRSSQRTVSSDVQLGAFYSSSAGNRNRCKWRSGRLTATPRSGPTNSRKLPRNTVDAAAP